MFLWICIYIIAVHLFFFFLLVGFLFVCLFSFVFWRHLFWPKGFLSGSDGKECACNAYSYWPRFDPWVGKIPWRREWLANPLFLPGEVHVQRNLEVYSPWGHKESDMTEQLTLSLLLFWPELYVSNSSVNQDQFRCHKSSSQEREYDWLSFGQLFSAHIPPLNCLHVQLPIAYLHFEVFDSKSCLIYLCSWHDFMMAISNHLHCTHPYPVQKQFHVALLPNNIQNVMAVQSFSHYHLSQTAIFSCLDYAYLCICLCSLQPILCIENRIIF